MIVSLIFLISFCYGFCSLSVGAGGDFSEWVLLGREGGVRDPRLASFHKLMMYDQWHTVASISRSLSLF